jgi:cytochrome c oxidase subunit 2
MGLILSTIYRSLLLILGLFSFNSAWADLGINFPEPAAEIAQDIYDIHMLTMKIATVILLVVIAIVAYSVYFHRKSRGVKPDLEFHETWFGHWSWIIIPVLVLGVDLTIASNANAVLQKIWEVPDEKDIMDIRVTGHQWWWEFSYLDHDIKVESRFTPQKDSGDLYLREVDNRLILPIDTKIRFLHTSADVIHAFWVPELGFKRDAIPGYVTESWTELNREGVFRGQCAEICGTWHSRMPIVVESVSLQDFERWVDEQKGAEIAAAAEAASDKVWTMEELMARGKATYETYCFACHQINGLGLPPAFPPLSGSPIATGPLDVHVKQVLNGVPGTAMQAWNSLDDLQIAAIVTYERNAWANNTGDVVQPSDVRKLR